jgi:hypothetical protein
VIRSRDFFWWSCSELVTHDLFVRPLWSGLYHVIPSRGLHPACNTASFPHNCVLSGTHCTCIGFPPILPLILCGFFGYLLLLEGARSLYQRSHLCLSVKFHAFPAGHGPIRDSVCVCARSAHGLASQHDSYLSLPDSTRDPPLWLCQTPVNPKAPRTCSLFAGILAFNTGLGYHRFNCLYFTLNHLPVPVRHSIVFEQVLSVLGCYEAPGCVDRCRGEGRTCILICFVEF